MQQHCFDVVVIGGGVNGTGIAMDAAGRGLSVLLCEMNDLASATSSNSSKLIHGGLRYLEHYEFRLVREALAEREALLRNSPHIMWPMRFRLPHRPHLRPGWMIRTGLFLYDHLAKRELLPGSQSIKFGRDSPLKPEITKGFEYSDGWVDDARLVVLMARKAAQMGAAIRPRTRCTQATRGEKSWAITLQDSLSGAKSNISATTLVNAAGPWASQLFSGTIAAPAPKQIRLVKGSHLVVPRLNNKDEAYILQNEDDRIVFVIPYEEHFSLIGTTDVNYEGDPSLARISAEETNYLLRVVNAYFRHQLAPDDVVWSYSGVRPLIDDGESAQEASRDYSYELDDTLGLAPLMSIFGGKITTYRKLAEVATDKLCEFFPTAGAPWTENAVLPGGNFHSKASLLAQLKNDFPWLPSDLGQRYVRTYGTACRGILVKAGSLENMGTLFTGNLYQKEIDYLVEQEWAWTAEDVLWRRTKQGLYASRAQIQALENYLSSASAKSPATRS